MVRACTATAQILTKLTPGWKMAQSTTASMHRSCLISARAQESCRGAHPIRNHEAVPTAQSRRFLSRMFLLFFTLMCPAHSCGTQHLSTHNVTQTFSCTSISQGGGATLAAGGTASSTNPFGPANCWCAQCLTNEPPVKQLQTYPAEYDRNMST
jgi:hypothetical protein